MNEFTLEALLGPVDGPARSGVDLRDDEIYTAIIDARRFDDPTLPREPWDDELQQADWYAVEDLCGNALIDRSKDLQLAVWFAEARLRTRGLASLGESIALVDGLIDRYWDNLYPPLAEGDDYRMNLVSWFGGSAVVLLNQVAIVESPAGSFARADWLTAARNAQFADTEPAEIEGATFDILDRALSQAPTEELNATYRSAENARFALLNFVRTIETREAPSFESLGDAIEDILHIVGSELDKRVPEASAVESTDDPVREAAPEPAGMLDRDQAYAALAEIAAFLRRADPHSPAPYLVHKAVEWSRLSTAELYEDLFVQRGGQIHIFDLLGLQEPVREV